MRKAYIYELYLIRKRNEYPFENIPNWLRHEREVYYWMFKLGREFRIELEGRHVSSQMLYRMKNIKTHTFSRCENISPELKEAFFLIQEAMYKFYKDSMEDPTYWIRPHYLSRKGLEHLEKVCDVVYEGRRILPNEKWREEYEKKYCK